MERQRADAAVRFADRQADKRPDGTPQLEPPSVTHARTMLRERHYHSHLAETARTIERWRGEALDGIRAMLDGGWR